MLNINKSSSLYSIPAALHKGSIIMMDMIFSDHGLKKSNSKEDFESQSGKKFHRLYIPLCPQIPQTFKNGKFKYFKQHKPMLLFAIC